MLGIKKILTTILYKTGLLSKLGRRGFKERIQAYSSNGRVLDIGCGGSPYAEFFPNRTSLDIVPGEGIDVVADVHDLSSLKKEEFDVVLCTEALEHFQNPFKAVEEMARVLKKGGLLILTTRFMFPLHEAPHDYFRFTEYGLRHLLKDFDIKEFQPDGNTIQTLAVLFQRIGYQCDTLWFKPFKLFWFISAKFTLLFSRILTREYGDITNKEVVKNIMASGYLVVALKK